MLLLFFQSTLSAPHLFWLKFNNWNSKKVGFKFFYIPTLLAHFVIFGQVVRVFASDPKGHVFILGVGTFCSFFQGSDHSLSTEFNDLAGPIKAVEEF